MENCRNCEAKLTPGMDWCPQCYTRIGPPQPGMPQKTPAQVAAGSSPLAPRELPVELLMQMPKYSRMKGGETSFGWMGRMMLSIGVFILGVIGYFVVVGNIGISPGWKSFELYLPVFLMFGGAMLWAVWRPARVDSRHR